MIRNEIVEQLYRRQTIEKTARKLFSHLKSEDTYNDLVQEVYLIICEMDEERLQRLQESREIDSYVARITINQIVNQNSTFNTKYIKLETHKIRKSLNENQLQQQEIEGGSEGCEGYI